MSLIVDPIDNKFVVEQRTLAVVWKLCYEELVEGVRKVPTKAADNSTFRFENVGAMSDNVMS